MSFLRHCSHILLSAHGERFSKRGRNYNPCPLWLVFQAAAFCVRPAFCDPDAHPYRGPFPPETVSPLPRGPVATPHIFPLPLFLYPFHGVYLERRQGRALCGADFHEYYREHPHGGRTPFQAVHSTRERPFFSPLSVPLFLPAHPDFVSHQNPHPKMVSGARLPLCRCGGTVSLCVICQTLYGYPTRGACHIRKRPLVFSRHSDPVENVSRDTGRHYFSIPFPGMRADLATRRKSDRKTGG